MISHAPFDLSLLRPGDTYFLNESNPVVTPIPSLLFVDSAGGHAARFLTKANDDFSDVVLRRDALDRLITWLTFLRDCEQEDVMGVAFEAARLAAKGGVTP